MEGINSIAAHGMLTSTMRSVDMCGQAAAAAQVHKEETLKELALRSESRRSRTYSGDRVISPHVPLIRAEFRRALLMRYSSVLGAWRQMDPRHHGRLAFFDFCRACRHLGYDGEARVLWEALDTDSDGFVSLWDVDSRLADLLCGFLKALVTNAGSAEAAWQEHFNTQGIGRCRQADFVKVCAHIGYTGDAEAVFRALNVDKASTGVSFQDFQLLDRWFKAAPVGRWEYHALRPTLPTGP
eukprot:TRINITY_DN63529_c0_g1_i1.p1 TRINITY_DN63529_c0_g1~~TRINITY_DN63529_c0_g1_i1.p1  ORF type:complete len:240 (-),score=45.59 TRINITY_DN63529_c0_g1_i1:82-801(-)